MKVYQWASIMWVLCMVCYYLSGKDWLPLIVASMFALFFALSMILGENPRGKVQG